MSILRTAYNKISGRNRWWDDLCHGVEALARGRGLGDGHPAWLFEDILRRGGRQILHESIFKGHKPLIPVDVMKLDAKQVEVCFLAYGVMVLRFCEKHLPQHTSRVDHAGREYFRHMWDIERQFEKTPQFPRFYMQTLIACCVRCGLDAYDEGKPPFGFESALNFRFWAEGMLPSQLDWFIPLWKSCEAPSPA